MHVFDCVLIDHSEHILAPLQGSSEIFFRKVKFWDKGGKDAPPVFLVDGVNYLHVKVLRNVMVSFNAAPHAPFKSPSTEVLIFQDGGVQLVATTRENVSPSLVLELLRRIAGIIKVSVLQTAVQLCIFFCTTEAV